jgi:hypothetical protein
MMNVCMRVYDELLDFHCVLADAMQLALTKKCWWVFLFLIDAAAAGADLYLCNWCSVQRVANRCKVLSSRRLGLLNSIEFDWTGADPLS